jgi:hypothetical protein
MRESHTRINAPAIGPTLEAVRHEFEIWRKRRRCRCRIPESLWQAAVEQCTEHSVQAVSRALRLNYNGLKNRVPSITRGRALAAGQHSNLGFVRLDLGSPMTPSEWLVEMEAPNGARMRMSFKGIPRDFDLMELSRAFWRQGR